MTILIGSDELLARRAERAPDVVELGKHLERDVARLLAQPLYVPEAKALLSRWGAYCRDDEAELLFDPFSPKTHTCSKCGHEWSTDQSHRWWVYWYQLWLAERVLMMALQSGPGGNSAAESRALETLALLVERYQKWPNADNVLGPTRPFFSTYLESIWVLQLAAAASTLRGLGRLPAGLETDLRERVFKPGAAIIADFDEGESNRQVWNGTALLALGAALKDSAMRDAAGKSVLALLAKGMRADGLWYEGENYHWFVLRGFTWAAQLLKRAGTVDLWTDRGDHGSRLRAALRAPVLTALPDFTFPARKDSKFGVSLRQRRMAELWEMMEAREAKEAKEANLRPLPPLPPSPSSPPLPSLLHHIYDPSIPERPDDFDTITEVERHEPQGSVRRTKLGWKAWLWMRPELPDADPEAWRPGTAHLEDTGLAIIRRDEGKTYISLDYGEYGGGHGHPDRLNLTAVLNAVPWLLDFGTGSYVAPSLAWYRSTLAHNAPLVDGHSQAPAAGRCVAFEERDDGYAWICGMLPNDSAYGGAAIQRTVVTAPGYVLDVVQLQSESADRQLALPWHGLGKLAADDGGLTFTRDEGELRIHLSARQRFQVMIQRADGPPRPDGSTPELEFPIVFAGGESVTLAACLDARGLVEDIDCKEDDFIVRLKDGSVDVHRATDDGWLIERDRGDAIELGGLRDAPEGESAPLEPPGEPVTMPPQKHMELNREEQFRRAELPYEPASFSARASVDCREDVLHVEVDVASDGINFRPGDAEDPEWENENPDIHSDGLQVYVDYGGFYGWLIVPDAEHHEVLRVAAARGTDAEAAMITEGSWEPTAQGYRVVFDIQFPEPLSGDFGFDLYVNRLHRGHERRSGQLVWSGARGQRLYLAGDRAMGGPLPRIRVK